MYKTLIIVSCILALSFAAPPPVKDQKDAKKTDKRSLTYYGTEAEIGFQSVPVVNNVNVPITRHVSLPVTSSVSVPVVKNVVHNVNVPITRHVSVPVTSSVSVPVVKNVVHNVDVPVTSHVSVPVSSSVSVPVVNNVAVPVVNYKQKVYYDTPSFYSYGYPGYGYTAYTNYGSIGQNQFYY